VTIEERNFLRRERERLIREYMERHRCTARAAKALLALDYPHMKWCQR
jgi:hypothetical protein